MPNVSSVPNAEPELPIEAALAVAFAATAPAEAETAAATDLVAETDSPALQPETPKLRLIQPYERPLLPFGEQESPREDTTITATTVPYKDPLEITVEELLVDLEETLSLIRTLRRKHASGGGG
jgi:hypothetical protein